MNWKEKILLVILIVWGSNIKVHFLPSGNAWIWWVLFVVAVLAFLFAGDTYDESEDEGGY